MKTRSSSGVGQKVDLEFDMECLRISDLSEAESSSAQPSILNSLRDRDSTGNSTGVIDSESSESGKIDADVQSTKLKQMLNQIKSQ
jgi:hypothetical protein